MEDETSFDAAYGWLQKVKAFKSSRNDFVTDYFFKLILKLETKLIEN